MEVFGDFDTSSFHMLKTGEAPGSLERRKGRDSIKDKMKKSKQTKTNKPTNKKPTSLILL